MANKINSFFIYSFVQIHFNFVVSSANMSMCKANSSLIIWFALNSVYFVSCVLYAYRAWLKVRNISRPITSARFDLSICLFFVCASFLLYFLFVFCLFVCFSFLSLNSIYLYSHLFIFIPFFFGIHFIFGTLVLLFFSYI